MTYSSFSRDRSVGDGRKNTDAAEGPAAAWYGSRAPSVEDAMGYVQMVKEAFEERHPDKYRLFLRTMDDFRNQRIGLAEVTSAARALFRDAPALALGFNLFLPKGHKLQVEPDDLAAYFLRDMSLEDHDDDD